MGRASERVSEGESNWFRRLDLLPPVALVGGAAFIVGVRFGFFLLLACATLMAMAIRVPPRQTLRLPALVVALLLFSLFALSSAAWAPDGREALTQAIPVLAAVVLGHVVAVSLHRAPTCWRARAATWTTLGAVVGALYLAAEIYSGYSILQALYNAIPALRPAKGSYFRLEGGRVTEIFSLTANWGVAALVMIAWPILLTLRSLVSRPRWRRLLCGGFAVVSALVVFASDHETAMIALVSSGIVFALAATLSQVVIRTLTMSTWVVIVLGVVPLAILADRGLSLERADWLPSTGKERILIWGHLARSSYEAPVLGSGVRSIRHKSSQRFEELKSSRQTREKLERGFDRARHAHNVYLQVWVELGLIGALLLCAAGLILLSGIESMAITARPYAYAAFAASVVEAGATWELWTLWFPAAFAIALCAMLLAEYVAREVEKNPPKPPAAGEA